MIRRTLPLVLIALGLATSGCALAEKVTEKPEPHEVEATPTPTAAINSLNGGDTTITFDAGFAGALEEAGIAVEPIGSAKVAGRKATLPVSGGNLTEFEAGADVKQPVIGRVEHSKAGLRLTGGGKTVDFELLTIDPGQASVNAKTTVDSQTVPPGITPLLTLAGKPTAEAKGATDTGAEAAGIKLSLPRLTLAREAASLLNSTFGTDALKPSTVVGAATIDARGTPAEPSAPGTDGPPR